MSLRKYIPEIIVLVYAILFLLTKNPASEWDRVIVSDGKGYYAYLTAVFIYQDTDYGFIDKYESEYYPASRQLYKDFRYNTGSGIVNKYFPGPALLWLPFFGAGHAAALILGYPADGYSLPYQWAIAFAAFFYFWLSLLILRKILRFYTDNESHIAWSLAVTGLATNLIYYTVNAGCQVHVYEFFLVGAFVYSVLAACKWGKPVHFAEAALSLGMVIISRPQDGLIVFAVPFLCGSSASLLGFLKNLFGKLSVLLSSILAFLLPLLVPVIYWFLKTGHFLVYSYGSESYNLARPHLFKFLFSFEKGWLLYTPVAAFAALGLIFLFQKSKWQFYTLSAFLFVVVYFMSSWWAWNYTSYISQRVMIDFYVFFAILLIFIFKLCENSIKRVYLPVILSGFIALNLMQHFQQLNWIYPAGPVTAKAYFSNFFSFSRGTTFMIPENEISVKQEYTNDFESEKSLFTTKEFALSAASHSGKNALEIAPKPESKLLFVRGLSDYKDLQPVIFRIGAWFNPETTDSTLTIEMSIGTSEGKYSNTGHNVMAGLKTGKWRYAEMAVYLPYIRSVDDSLFISFRNLTRGKVLADDVQICFLKMQPLEHHDWILAPDNKIDTAIAFKTDLESPLSAPFGNQATISSEKSFSVKQASCISENSPFSVSFEKELEPFGSSDGYIRVCARISGERSSDLLLVFDFSAEGKTILYKTYHVVLPENGSGWIRTEIFRELPVEALKARKVKIYYWYTKGENPVFVDDMQVDFVKYRKAELQFMPKFPLNSNPGILSTVCCDFENTNGPAQGNTVEVSNAFSGNNVNLVNTRQPFSYNQLMPLAAFKANADEFVYVNAKVNTDQYTSTMTLVADFRQNGKSFSYNPDYLHGQTIKGQWSTIGFGVKIPEGITARDSVLVYFYLPKGDEECMIDDFCVSLRKPGSTPLSK